VIVAPERRQAKALARLQRRIDKNGPVPSHRPDLGPCWLWTGYRYPTGYGKFSVGLEQGYAHIWSFRLHIGPVPDGKELDHLCRNPSCVNPNHLEPVTHRENVLRGEGPAAANARKTHCIHGHPFDEGNTYRLPSGAVGRDCRICRNEAAARWRVRHFAANLSAEQRAVIQCGRGAYRGVGRAFASEFGMTKEAIYAVWAGRIWPLEESNG
jgi:hypothetical protein